MPSGAAALHGLDDLSHEREELHPFRDATLTPVLLDPPCCRVQPVLPLLRAQRPAAVRLALPELTPPVGLHRCRGVV
jgi:hypothetical protein